MKKSRLFFPIGAETWYQLEFNKQKGWIKDGTGFKKISAYKWKDWGFTVPPIKDDPDDFIFDGNEKGDFMKKMFKEIDTDKDGNITTEELQTAIKRKATFKKLTGIINYHKTEWAGEVTSNLFVKEFGKMLDAIIDNANEAAKENLRNAKNKLSDLYKKIICASGIWQEIKEFSKTEQFYFHPIAFVEQMKKVMEKPMISPVKNYRSTSEYGNRIHPIRKVVSFHTGIDLVGSLSIMAPCDGKVTKVFSDATNGNTIFIEDLSKNIHKFCHLKDNSIKVSVESFVIQGQEIATMGTTGSSTGVHLHYQIHPGGGGHVDPRSINEGLMLKK